MTINLLLVLLLHAEDDLRRQHLLIWKPQFQIRVQPKCRGVLEEMRLHLLLVDPAFHVTTFLVYAEEGEDVEHARVDLLAAVGYDTDDYLEAKWSRISLGKLY